MLPTQMLKGTLEGCILKIISRSETYGYEISQQLQQYGFPDIAEGTIYPLLLRLEKNHCITAKYRESAVGPKRKYFSVTEEGKKELDGFIGNWNLLCQAVQSLFSGKDEIHAHKRIVTEKTTKVE